MERMMCKGKIHRATVTDAHLDYMGSITIDFLLMSAANIRPYEIVQVTSFRNANRWKTYAIPAEEGSGKICLNGPPAHLFKAGDKVVILSMGSYTDDELISLVPRVVFVDEDNRIESCEDHPLYNEKGEINRNGFSFGKMEEI